MTNVHQAMQRLAWKYLTVHCQELRQHQVISQHIWLQVENRHLCRTFTLDVVSVLSLHRDRTDDVALKLMMCCVAAGDREGILLFLM